VTSPGVNACLEHPQSLFFPSVRYDGFVVARKRLPLNVPDLALGITIPTDQVPLEKLSVVARFVNFPPLK
jgi:hypothetical protein